MKDYYTGLYYSFEYFYVPLTTTDEEGNSVDLDDSAKAELKTQLEGYVDQINDGDLTVSEARTITLRSLARRPPIRSPPLPPPPADHRAV